MSLYDVFFPQDDDLPEGLTEGEKQLIAAARRAGYRIDAPRVKRVSEAKQARQEAISEGRIDREGSIRQAAIESGFLPKPEAPEVTPEESET